MFLTVPRLFNQILWEAYGNHTKSFLWDIFDKPKILARDVFETSQRCYGKDIFFEICPRRPKDVTQKKSFLGCFWDVLKTSQKRHLFLRCFWEVSETPLSMELWLRSLRDISCRLGSSFYTFWLSSNESDSNQKPKFEVLIILFYWSWLMRLNNYYVK